MEDGTVLFGQNHPLDDTTFCEKKKTKTKGVGNCSLNKQRATPLKDYHKVSEEKIDHSMSMGTMLKTTASASFEVIRAFCEKPRATSKLKPSKKYSMARTDDMVDLYGIWSRSDVVSITLHEQS
ncbi:hypothetical protein Salat_2858200 [Sesamum alatum]|uniref:Uncharacterized protein n=1 Tax=Sesamum alatum TaxID=300844 RepID=A0AAE2C9Z6_9LAMI|nr:hypothetical protein Salat_2858200 [Sesamum alatum]